MKNRTIFLIISVRPSLPLAQPESTAAPVKACDECRYDQKSALLISGGKYE